MLSPLHAGKSKTAPVNEDDRSRSLVLALAAYVILLVLAFSANLIDPLEQLLDSALIRIEFPAVATSFAWQVPAETGRNISILGHAGAILFYAGLISFLLYRRAGYYRDRAAWGIIWGKVRRSALKSTISILALVAMASLMTHTGMTQIIARGISETVDAAIYPLFAPFIGTLGAFMTGSNTKFQCRIWCLAAGNGDAAGFERADCARGSNRWRVIGQRFGAGKSHRRLQHGWAERAGKVPVIRRMLLLGLIPVVFVALVTFIRLVGV